MHLQTHLQPDSLIILAWVVKRKCTSTNLYRFSCFISVCYPRTRSMRNLNETDWMRKHVILFPRLSSRHIRNVFRSCTMIRVFMRLAIFPSSGPKLVHVSTLHRISKSDGFANLNSSDRGLDGRAGRFCTHIPIALIQKWVFGYRYANKFGSKERINAAKSSSVAP